MNKNYDVIVVGAGHAGVEAAYAAAGMGVQTLLLTLDTDKIALMPCNPSIGGLGKGHIVYEVSALGGLMPKLCSKTYLQARMLNTRKGPAVQGLRLQIDKYKYSKLAKEVLQQTKNLTIRQDMAIELLTEKSSDFKKVVGIKTETGGMFFAKSVIITAGTFLNGKTFIGFNTKNAGRVGEQSVPHLTQSLEEALNKKSARLKTGTPPRIDKNTVDFTKLEKQKENHVDYLFEFEELDIKDTTCCYIAQTNEKTHEIIKNNFEKSALFGGKIEGVGPRYCPSIEDKIKRHPDRNSHHVFIEPDGEFLEEVYPSGLSTSLPLDVQIGYITSMKGFENAKILQPGYAIEYDFFQPNILKHTLETKDVDGLFFAGQINGTTGYEEAAGQGLVAGINAALQIQNKGPFILNRTESYIGVMIDDLITIGVDEPYRMFTSRAERRLILRQDNVFLRLMPYGKKLGLVSDELCKKFEEEKDLIKKGLDFVKKNKHKDIFKLFHSVVWDKETKQKAKDILEKELNLKLNSRALLNIHAQVRYDGYIQKEQNEVEKVLRYQELKIPESLNYANLPGLTVELQQKLNYYKPKTIAQAQLIPGMTPAAVSILIFKSREITK